MGPLVSDYIQQAWDRRAAVKGVSESVVEGGGVGDEVFAMR